jgi:hypothetical protein
MRKRPANALRAHEALRSRLCRDLTFSDDRTRVHLVSDNVPNHATMDGLLTDASETSLVYSIDDGWAGAELVVRLDGDTRVGQLSIFGSGVPVVFCMESVMQPR